MNICDVKEPAFSQPWYLSKLYYRKYTIISPFPYFQCLRIKHSNVVQNIISSNKCSMLLNLMLECCIFSLQLVNILQSRNRFYPIVMVPSKNITLESKSTIVETWGDKNKLDAGACVPILAFEYYTAKTNGF